MSQVSVTIEKYHPRNRQSNERIKRELVLLFYIRAANSSRHFYDLSIQIKSFQIFSIFRRFVVIGKF